MHTPDSPAEPTVARGSPALLRASGGRLAHRLHAGLIVALPTLALVFAALAFAAHAVRPWHMVGLALMAFVTILAITVGFHRLLTHRAFQTGRTVKLLLIIVA